MENNEKIGILVLEDEQPLLNAISRKLKSEGFEPVSCRTAEQALDYLENIEELPELIWLDFYLPGLNGIEFMAKLKENESWSKIPVVVVSNSASNKKVNTMLGLGAAKYILKAEHKLEDIVRTMRELVENENSTSN